MTTKREKKFHDLRRRIQRLEQDRSFGISLIVKAETKLPALRKELTRMADRLLKTPAPTIKQAAPEPKPEPKTMTYEIRPQDGNGGIDLQLVTVPASEDDDIPGFLRRGAAAQRAANDAIAAAEVKAELEATKKRKAARAAEKRQIKKETIDAELRGQRRKMPLTGKAALAAIKG